METLLVLLVFIFGVSAMFCIMHALMEGYGFDKIAGVTAISAIVLLIVLMPFYFESDEQKREQVHQCEWIVDNVEQFMTYGEPR